MMMMMMMIFFQHRTETRGQHSHVPSKRGFPLRALDSDLTLYEYVSDLAKNTGRSGACAASLLPRLGKAGCLNWLNKKAQRNSVIQPEAALHATVPSGGWACFQLAGLASSPTALSNKLKRPIPPRAYGVVQVLLLLSVFLLFIRRFFFECLKMRAYNKKGNWTTYN